MKKPRILHLADRHVYLQGPRAEECRRIHGWIAEHVRDAKPDLIIDTGDVSEKLMSPQERLFQVEFLRSVSSVSPVVIISGNHDDRDDLRLFRKEYGWTMPVQIFLEPGLVMVGGVVLALLPWPDLGRLATVAVTDSIEGRREVAKAALIDVLRGMRDKIPAGEPSLLLAHMPVTGASMDSGQPVSGGHEISLSPDELLECGAAGVALGHIHLRQQMASGDGRPVFYAGAPFRGGFGEAKGTKGGLIWDWDGKAWQVTPWEIPARSMVLVETTWTPPQEDALAQDPGPLADPDLTKDADVRVRITFPAEHREAMRAAMAPALDALREIANSVKIEETAIVVSRTRCSDIQAARTTIEKVQAWAQAVGQEIPAGAETKLAVMEGAAS